MRYWANNNDYVSFKIWEKAIKFEVKGIKEDILHVDMIMALEAKDHGGENQNEVISKSAL